MPLSEKKSKAIEWIDPLYQVFEHFLFTRTYEDSNAFTREVASQYLAYLDATVGFIPAHARKAIQEDLESEIHEMLVKKIYGFSQQTTDTPLPPTFPKLSIPPKSSSGGEQL